MKFKILMSAIIFQISTLFVMLGYAYAPIYFGEEIKVDVRLYDPRDLLRGNYVRLSYDFSNLPSQYSPYDSNTTVTGDKIYVKLKNIDGIYVKDDFSLTKPQSGVFLSGRVEYSVANFGIEAFFMPPDKALKMERDIRDYGALAILSVMKNGKARVKEIILKSPVGN